MTRAHWTDRLSEYVDGELDEKEREAAELHLLECPACAELVAELRQVVAEAATLEDRAPERDLWSGIADRLAPRAPGRDAGSAARPGLGAGAVTGAGGGSDADAAAGTLSLGSGRRDRTTPRRRVALTVPQLLAAGIALVVLSAGGVWLAAAPGAAPGRSPGAAVAGGAGAGAVEGAGERGLEEDRTGPAGTEVAGAVPVAYTAAFDEAIGELEREFALRREQLDAETILVVERNLAIIDSAISEARRALEEDPSSGFLNTHLANAMRRKVDLLRQVTRIERTEI